MEDVYDLLIVGGGPAAFSAGIYGGRAGLNVLIVDEGAGGGQMALSPLVENYPGYEAITGMELTEKMLAHALRYAKLEEGYEVEAVETGDGFFLAKGSGKEWKAKALILATGAEHRKLGVPGEKEFYGRGVSYCATCDGFFFKGRDVIVVGGGDSAISESRYLLSVGAKVRVIHRRSELRAEQANQDAFFKEGGEVLWNKVVEEFTGDQALTGAKLKDTVTGEASSIDIHGAFVAIGYLPRNEIAKGMGVAVDDDGYITTDIRQRTSVPGVFAAGDITGGLKQVVTAVGQGAKAALSAYDYIKESRESR